MTYSISRNYSTDLSRTEVRTLLVNAAKELADVKNFDVPTKTVFEEPDVLGNYDADNRFEIAVRPTVTDAGVEPEDIIPAEVVIRGTYVKLHGMTSAEGEEDGRAKAHVTVCDADNANTGTATDWEDYVAMWERITAAQEEEN